MLQQTGRIVGDDGIDPGGDQPIPILRRVRGPGHHLQSGRVRRANLLRSDQMELGRDDAGSRLPGRSP